MTICFLCGRRIWPWQKRYGKFHLECYLEYHNILFFEEDENETKGTKRRIGKEIDIMEEDEICLN